MALNALAAKEHIALVAEGVPLHFNLSQQDAAKLSFLMKPGDEVSKVAAAYGYTVEHEGSVFILKKRYSDPDDLPEITLPECAYALASVQRVAEPFNPHLPPDQVDFLTTPGPSLRRNQYRISNPIVNLLATSLSPDQLELMKEDKLPVSSLSPPQKKLARKVLLYISVQKPLEDAIERPMRLEELSEGMVFSWQDVGGMKHTFGYTLPKVSSLFSPLNGKTEQENMMSISIGSGKPLTVDDPTNPVPIQDSNSRTYGKSLAKAVASLNSIHATVDEAVATKTVTVAGLENCSVLQTLQALADVYGLRVLKVNTDHFTLALPNVSVPSDIAALSAAQQQSIPDPFKRAVHMDQIIADESKYYDFLKAYPNLDQPVEAQHDMGAEETSAQMEASMKERRMIVSGPELFHADQQEINHAIATLSTLRFAAIRRLRSLVEPKLQSSPNSVPLKDLGESEHEAVATILLVDAVQILITDLTTPTPETMSHFNDVVLGGGVYGDPKQSMFGITFNMPLPNGHVRQEGSIGGLDYIK